jgi:hypothetical protein
MRISATCLVIAASLQASVVLAACEMPALVTSIPDGATATEQELVAVQTEIQAYVAAMDRYIACQNEAMRIDEEGSTEDYLYLMSRRIESAREEVDMVAADFNDQVTAFRAARQAAPDLR